MSLLDDIFGDSGGASTSEPMTADKLMAEFRKQGQSGNDILTPRQCLMALKGLNYLGKTEKEIKDKILSARKTCGDGKGNVNLVGFSYVLNAELAAESAKREAEAAQPRKLVPTNSNPFSEESGQSAAAPASSAMGGSDDFWATTNSLSQNNSKMRVEVSQEQTGELAGVGQPQPMEAAPSVDELADASEPTAVISIPSWFGHSLDSPMVSDADEDDDPMGFMFGDDDDKVLAQPKIREAKSMGPTLMVSSKSTGTGSATKKRSPRRGKREKSPSPRPVDFTFITNYADGGSEQIVTPRTGKAKRDFEERKGSKKSGSSSSSSRDSISDSRDSDDDRDADDEKTSSSSKKKKKIPKSSRRAGEKDHRGGSSKKDKKKRRKRRPRTDAIAAMQKGASMLKYGRRGFPHFRRFQLARDCSAIQWFSSRKAISETQILISDIKNVIEGQQTQVFKQCNQKSLEKASFSVVYGSKMKTLDLVAKSQEEARLWVKGLSGLLRAERQGKLNKVAQILVDVNYTDITQLDYSSQGGKKTSAITKSFNDIDKLRAVETTLQQSQATYKKIQKSMNHKAVLEHPDYEQIQENVTGYENRFQEIEFALAHKTVMLSQLKRDVWVLKVEVSSCVDQLASIKKGGKGGLFGRGAFGF